MNQWIIGIVSVVLVGYVASAQPPKRGAGSFPMQRADSNGDGKVSWAEVHEMAPRYTQERFNNLDRNGDGMLSKDDVRPRPNGATGRLPQGDRLIAILRRADADGDSRVTKEELEVTAPQLARQGFARLDTNKDGVISESDSNKQRTNGAPSPEAIREADANGDGYWSYEELKTVAKRITENVFRDVDSDGNGLLNSDELQALRRRADRRRSPQRGNPQAAQIRRDAIDKILESDANGDGGVSYDELAAAKPGYPQSAFARNDRNRDGVVSRRDSP